MGFDDCFECGEPGHLAANCPTRLAESEAKAPKPLWCRNCDKETRLIDGKRRGRQVIHRCAACHPLRSVTLRQHKRCGGCKELVYTWDNSPCGTHPGMALI